MRDIKYKKFESDRRFGVEMETGVTLSKTKVRNLIQLISDHEVHVSKYQLTGESKKWHVKDDSTCGPLGQNGPKGIEVASFVAKGEADLNHIADTADALYKAGSRVNGYCGLHVHAEAKDLTPDQVGTLIAYWLRIQDVIGMSLPADREHNDYCKKQGTIFNALMQSNRRWGSTGLDSKIFFELLKPRNLKYYDNDDRRRNLNLVNYCQAIQYDTDNRKTLELRWPEGTLSGTDIKCWVRLFLNFIDCCKDLPFPDFGRADLNETLTCLGLNHEASFVILSEELFVTKTWFLERILQFNATNYAMLMRGMTADLTPGQPGTVVVNDYPVKVVTDAKAVLNRMWSPVKKYA